MATLQSFYTDVVPTASYADLRAYAVVFTTSHVADYLEGQTNLDLSRARTSVQALSDGRYLLNADLLKEFQSGGGKLYDPGFEAVVLEHADVTTVEDWDATVALTQAPAPEALGATPPTWVQPVPGLAEQWFNMGYPFGFIVEHEGFTYRSTLDFNVWAPRLGVEAEWELHPPQAIAWQSGQVWNTGDIVSHTSADDPSVPYWESGIDANTTEPGYHGGHTYWYARSEYDPAAPKEYKESRSYDLGEAMTINGDMYESTYTDGANVWSPTEFPSSWKLIP